MAKHPKPTPAAKPSKKKKLTGDELAKVTGGATAEPPRDVASGMPTGKRMHKPYTSTS